MKQLVIAALIALAAGFFLGRSTIKDQDPIIEYVKGETITDTITNIQVDSIVVPKIIYLPMVADTIYVNDTFIVTTKVDTAAVLADYVLKRFYNETLFDNDTNGSMYVRTMIQYNRMGKLEYEFTPIRVERTIHEKRLLVPFARMSINTHKYFGVGGGIYIRDLGIGVDYINDLILEDPGWELSVSRKF